MGKTQERKLTDIQVKFCKEYILDFDGKASAERAGYSKNSKNKKSFEVKASQLLKMPEIQKKIKELIEKDNVKHEDKREKVINELMNIAFSNIVKIRERLGRNELTEEEQRCIKRLQIFRFPTGTIRHTVEQHDKMKSLELLCRHFGLLNDKIDHNFKASHKDIMKLISDIEAEPREAND